MPREIFLRYGVKSLLIGSGYRKDTTMLLYGYYTTMRREIIGQWGDDHKEMFLWIAALGMPAPVHGAHLRALSSSNTCYRFFSRAVGGDIRKQFWDNLPAFIMRSRDDEVSSARSAILLSFFSPAACLRPAARTASGARIKKVEESVREYFTYIRGNIHL